IYGQRPGAPVKPDPAIVHDILRTLGASAGQTLYVGDSAVDMETARRSGIPSIGVLWGFRPEAELREAGARYLVSSPSDILNYL
ncbi:MAG: HAD-IA family hydrolase, partial [Bacteroidales bacterium]|nr:HAD-IA family hydrolase [Bacteroidales bacterium]